MGFGELRRRGDRRVEMLFRTLPLLLLISLEPFVIVTRRSGIRAGWRSQDRLLRCRLTPKTHHRSYQHRDREHSSSCHFLLLRSW